MSGTNLPVGQINVLILTDTHSWLAGHRHPDNDPALNADYGDVLSFYRLLQQQLTAESRDLFLVNNGDIVDGTGLSTVPPERLVPLVQMMPWDALGTGNHELYRNDNIDFLTREGGWIDTMGPRYLTANVADADGVLLGEQFRILEGSFGSKLVVFGFLYNMEDHASDVTVKRVQDVVEEPWFTSALQTADLDAVMLLSHMGHDNDLQVVILDKIREVLGSDMPVLFVSGHTHRRREATLDPACFAFEAGNYLNTVGFATIPAAGDFVQNSATDATQNGFDFQYIDPNLDSMAGLLGITTEQMTTDEGEAMSAAILQAQQDLGILEELGCAPQFYFRFASLDADNSLWGLYQNEVVPSVLFNGDPRKILLQGTGSLRYDLYNGSVLVDDIVTMSPFGDDYHLVATDVPGNDVLGLQEILNGGDGRDYLGGRRRLAAPPSSGKYGARHVTEVFERRLQSVPRFIMSGNPENSTTELYEVYTVSFDLAFVTEELETILGRELTPTIPYPDIDGTSIWSDYVSANWPCSGDSSSGSSSSSDGLSDGGVAGVVIAVLFVLGAAAVAAFFVFRGRQSQPSVPKSKEEAKETEAEAEGDRNQLLEYEVAPQV